MNTVTSGWCERCGTYHGDPDRCPMKMAEAGKGIAPVSVNSTELVDGDAEALARRFHETYERLAPSFGYETRKASAVPWERVPEQNKALMRAVAAELLKPSTEKVCDR